MSPTHKCDKCDGAGKFQRFTEDGRGGKVFFPPETCPRCGGSGVCSLCNGVGATYGHALNVLDGRSLVVVVEAHCHGRKKIR